MKKTMGEFTLEIKEGEFTDSEIVVMLGENGEFATRRPLRQTEMADKPIDDSSLARLQARGKPRLSGCWLDTSNPMEEVRLYHTRGWRASVPRTR